MVPISDATSVGGFASSSPVTASGHQTGRCDSASTRLTGDVIEPEHVAHLVGHRPLAGALRHDGAWAAGRRRRTAISHVDRSTVRVNIRGLSRQLRLAFSAWLRENRHDGKSQYISYDYYYSPYRFETAQSQHPASASEAVGLSDAPTP
jgi:hypothetical protein